MSTCGPCGPFKNKHMVVIHKEYLGLGRNRLSPWKVSRCPFISEQQENWWLQRDWWKTLPVLSSYLGDISAVNLLQSALIHTELETFHQHLTRHCQQTFETCLTVCFGRVGPGHVACIHNKPHHMHYAYVLHNVADLPHWFEESVPRTIFPSWTAWRKPEFWFHIMPL